jgi:hypothetical protein
MLSKEEFVQRILDGVASASRRAARDPSPDAFTAADLDWGDTSTKPSIPPPDDLRFAQLLLEEVFGRGEAQDRDEIVLGDQRTSRLLPNRGRYWPKTTDRPFHIVLFELEKKGREILDTSLFKGDLLEDALHRVVQDVLDGFEKKRIASARQGAQTQTLCVVSIVDDRKSRHIVCFGTKSITTNALEIFTLREEVRDWDRPLAEEHLDQLSKRHFKKLVTPAWQDAFITGEERKKIKALLDACTKPSLFGSNEEELRKKLRDVLDEIAGSFGIWKKSANLGRRLDMIELPVNHGIGADPDESQEPGFKNPLQGVRIYDRDNRLLGFVVYVASSKAKVDTLQEALATNNHFHNVLVIYPDSAEPELELWQGSTPLRGRLTRGPKRTQFDGEGGVVQLLSRFFVVSKSAIEKPKQLAEELAWRARHLRALAVEELEKEIETGNDKGPLKNLFDTFNSALATLTVKNFADAYAQTITYGMLAARWISSDDENKPLFTRKNLKDLLPETSAFLQDLFDKLVNSNFDKNLTWLLDDITGLLARTSVAQVFQDEKRDPSIHFYEDFLDAYDPQVRKDQGVYYTPDEVVSYIVRTAHASLQNDFGLPLGLADTTTWAAFAKSKKLSVPEGVDPKKPFVQVLDPALGTGTFLLRVIEVIHETMQAEFEKQGLDEEAARKAWVSYVRKDLLPRINGFELMMAPYIVSHLRLGLALQETGFTFTKNDRLRVFLTNTLEPRIPRQLDFLGTSVAEEANLAAAVKSDLASTVLVGNPPYAIQSANLTVEARALIEPFKFVNGERIQEKGALQLERNLNDDYVKFWSYVINALTRSTCGIASLITNRAYSDNPTLRGMRWAMLDVASHVELVDLHGDIKRKEKPPSGQSNDNVFNILQGVAITSLTRMPDKQRGPLAPVRRTDVWGSRPEKLLHLPAVSIGSAAAFVPGAPEYPFIANSDPLYEEYSHFAPIDRAVSIYSNGLVTARDGLVVDFDKSALLARIQAFSSTTGPIEGALEEFCVSAKKGWDGAGARAAVAASLRQGEDWLMPFLYRPFELAWIYYHPNLIQTMASTTWHMCAAENVAILVPRTVKGGGFQHVMVTRQMSEAICLSTKTSVNGNCFPLWTYSDAKKRVLAKRGVGGRQTSVIANGGRAPNIDPSRFFETPASGALASDAAAETAFFYAAALLHSKEYRKRYSDLLGRGFPRIPKALSLALAQELAAFGRRLPALYDLSAPELNGSKSVPGLTLTGLGDSVVRRAEFDESHGCVWINDGQRLAPISAAQWAFSIGDYQAIQRWLVGGRAVTRKGRTLSQKDLDHLSKVLRAIDALSTLPADVDAAIERHGGWPNAFSLTGEAVELASDESEEDDE